MLELGLAFWKTNRQAIDFMGLLMTSVFIVPVVDAKCSSPD